MVQEMPQIQLLKIILNRLIKIKMKWLKINTKTFLTQKRNKFQWILTEEVLISLGNDSLTTINRKDRADLPRTWFMLHSSRPSLLVSISAFHTPEAQSNRTKIVAQRQLENSDLFSGRNLLHGRLQGKDQGKTREGRLDNLRNIH